MQAAKQNIIDIIAKNGPITFADFMHQALYNPIYGYYMQNTAKLGIDGDFTTAPEISPMFGACIANQIDEYINSGNGNIDILELGPGTGSLARSILTKIKNKDAIRKYYMLEISASLKDQQISNNKEFGKKISHITAIPDEFSGVIVANEVLDAMPVNKFTIADKLLETYVDFGNDNFCYVDKVATNQDLIAQVAAIDTLLPPGYSSEINLAASSWITSLAQALKKGLILLIDYGYNQNEYYHLERHGGTLTCFYKMRAHNNPLINVGAQDITAHVDFTALAKAGLAANLNLIGYVEQAHFLMNLDLMKIAEENYAIDPLGTAKALKLLTMPSEMGSLCKVMGFSKNTNGQEYTGFCNYNKVESLF